MKQIPLIGKYGIDRFALVDDVDFEEVNKYKWRAKKSHNNYYAVRVEYIGRVSKGKYGSKFIQLHSFIMKTPKGMMTDHKNHNGLDCQRDNMRICTVGENNRNVSSHKNTSSQYLGVSATSTIVKGKKYSYWRGTIKSNGVIADLGTFKSEENAAIAYNIYAEKLHGEFANFNKVQQCQ